MRKRNGTFVIVTLGLVVLAALRGKLRRYEIVESSMEPQLSGGDYLIARRRDSDLHRGDIVIVPHPDIVGFDLVKRVIGLPGELVTLANGQVHIDGQVLAEPWADGPVRHGGEWQTGPDEVFVLGDNRPVSAADSRTIGPVSASEIEWRAIARYWPMGRLGRLTPS